MEDGELVGIVTKRDLLRADTTTVMKDRLGSIPYCRKPAAQQYYESGCDYH